MRTRASGIRALVWGQHSTAAQIAASDHGSSHDAATPEAHYSSVATNGCAGELLPSIFVLYLGLVCEGMLLQLVWDCLRVECLGLQIVLSGFSSGSLPAARAGTTLPAHMPSARRANFES